MLELVGYRACGLPIQSLWVTYTELVGYLPRDECFIDVHRLHSCCQPCRPLHLLLAHTHPLHHLAVQTVLARRVRDVIYVPHHR